MITADLTRNPKQAHFVDTVLAAAYGDNPFRYLFYGGGIRGGKTFACLIALILLCRLFPGSKWYVIRKTFPTLMETSIPALQKILGKSTKWRWNRDKSNFYVEHTPTESRIFFAGEDYNRDPKMNWLLGLEANGFFLEQVEELQAVTLDMCISRAGSWYLPLMPTPLILGSFNPTLTWVRTKIYLPYSEGTLVAPFFFQEALPDDNPWVTDEQWAAWGHMSDELQAQFIEGSWEFSKPANVFAWAYNEVRHDRRMAYDDSMPLYLSFDFNVEPITCLANQHTRAEIRTIKEFRLLNSDIDDLCEHIVAEYRSAHFVVTGDASGASRTALKKNLNYYKAIKTNLQISPLQLRVPKANPGVRNTRVLVNSLLAKHPSIHIDKLACPHLVMDLNSVVVGDDGEIDKDKDKRKTHLLDCYRYYCWQFHREFLDKSIYAYAGNQ